MRGSHGKPKSFSAVAESPNHALSSDVTKVDRPPHAPVVFR